eukprot:364695-Chlamydomonas_euryale.AAC.3
MISTSGRASSCARGWERRRERHAATCAAWSRAPSTKVAIYPPSCLIQTRPASTPPYLTYLTQRAPSADSAKGDLGTAVDFYGPVTLQAALDSSGPST